MEVKKMLEFNSGSGVTYLYDDRVGLSIPLSGAMRTVIEEMRTDGSKKEDIIEKLKDRFQEEDIVFCYDWIKKWSKIQPSEEDYILDMKDISPQEIKEFTLKNSLLHLTLCTTEDCNFRCKYCVYSDQYEYTRGYSHTYMNFKTARKAIDHFFSLLKEGKRYNPIREPCVGFYGGEPLLNFKLIKRCVEYIEDEYKDYKVSYTITTNGSLLDEEISDFLTKYDFSIGISLDGPQEEHDRLRVYKNGKGTFSDIMKNVKRIMEQGYEKIHSLAVFDWKTDLSKLEEFFSREDVPRLSHVTMVDMAMGCSYYKRFTQEDYLRFQKQFESARKDYLHYIEHLSDFKEQKRISFYDLIFGQSASSEVFGNIAVIPSTPIMPVTGACIPGRKIYVDVEGNFHICERINEAFPIGNVDEGLNFDKVAGRMRDYFQSLDRCSSCKVRRLCNICYCGLVAGIGGKEFGRTSEICQNVESVTASGLADAFTIGEINPEVVEECAGIYYKMLNKLGTREE
jgi:uncharacterized protein